MFPRNVWLVALGFFWLFGGFAAAQQYLVPVFALQGRENLALISLLVLYVAFLAATPTVPVVLNRIGSKWALLLGMAGFASFVACIAVNANILLVYTVAILAGFGSAFVWVTGVQVIQQSSLTQNLGGNLGFQSAVYWLGSWLGVASGAFFLERISIGNLYGVFLIAILASGVFFGGIKSTNEISRQGVNIGYAFSNKLLLLIPVVVGTFFVSTLGFSALNLIAVSFGLGFVGLLSTAGQTSRILGGYLSGWLSDHLPKEFLLYALMAFALVGVGLIVLIPHESMILFGVVLLGVALAAVYPVTTAFLSEKIAEEEYIKATSVFFLYAGIGSVSALGATLVVDPRTSFLPGVVLLLVAFPAVRQFAKSKKEFN